KMVCLFILLSCDMDTRWKQQLDNYERALTQLRKFIKKGSLNELEEQGLIQAFEYTHELAWKTLKRFLEEKGITTIYDSRDTTREAFQKGLLEDGELWMEMIVSRNKSTHTYNQDTATELNELITENYYHAFEKLLVTLKNISEN
ncbi:MAG: nucleotidyltransferase substrate binding protein, partial [Cyclobacteriaceae bacterium]